MTYSSSDLQSDIDLKLRDLGYEICGDDDTLGWSWQLGDFSSTSVMLAFETAAEASADALRDLVDRTQELLAAARLVVAEWSAGDLAAAVRELDACARAFDDADEVEGEEPSPESAVALAVPGRPETVWLLHGVGATGDWVEAAYCSLDGAMGRAIDIVATWVRDRVVGDGDQFLARLRSTHRACSCGGEVSMEIEAITLFGRTV